MNEQPHTNTTRKSTPSPKDHAPYVKLITEAINAARKHPDQPKCFADQIADHIIYLSFLKLPTPEWKKKFLRAQTKAISSWNGPKNYARAIARDLLTPDVERECLKLFPHIDTGKYFNHTITPATSYEIKPRTAPAPIKHQPHRRAELWKLTPRWDHLWRSSSIIFLEILRRTQYPKRPENFPWCQAGIKSLAKFTGYEERQVKRALHQLEDYKLIKRIYRAYPSQGPTKKGPSKYFVFLTPDMSGAFSCKSDLAKKH